MMRPMIFTGLVVAGLSGGILGGLVGPAEAVPIRTLAGLSTISVFERTGTTHEIGFTPDSAAVTTRLSGDLAPGNRDFQGVASEHYDLFYSDADGSFNPDGAFLSIEAAFLSSVGGGGNISGAALNFGPGAEFATVVSSFVGGNAFNPATLDRAVDGLLNTFATLGGTDTPDQRMRITLGFASSAPASQNSQNHQDLPAPEGLLALAAAGLIALRRRKG